MKKVYFILFVCSIVASFFAGYFSSSSVKCAYEVSDNVINAQQKALDYAAQVMSQNDLYDIDGSDIMSDYLEATTIAEEWYLLYKGE